MATITERLGTVAFDHWTTQSIGQITPLYVRGTGFHQDEPRVVQAGSASLVPENQRTSKGLAFVKIDRATHLPIPLSGGQTSVVFNTHASDSASTALANLLNNVKENEIGILTSCDRFEGSVNEALENATKRVGLLRLSQFIRGKRMTNDSTSQRAYAAIFSGAGSQAKVRQAWETFQPSGEHTPPAIISTFLIDGGFGSRAAPTELVPADPNATTEVGVVVNQEGRVGIGTRTPTEQLDVQGNVRVSGNLIGNVSGRATTAKSWATPRTLTLNGDIKGNVVWDGSANVSMTTTLTSFSEKTVTVPSGGTGQTSFLKGSILVGQGTDPVESFANLVWDETNDRLGVGTSDPSESLEVVGNVRVSDTLVANVVEGKLDRTVTFVDGTQTVVGTFDNTGDVTVPVGSGINASIDAVGAPEYNAFTPKDGAFYGGTSDPNPDSEMRLNYQGILHASEYQGPLIGPDVSAGTVTCGTATVTELFTTDRLVSDTIEGTSAVFNEGVEALEFIAVSDAKFKTNVQTLENAMDMVRNMRGVRYNWVDARKSGPVIGVIAQEMLKVVPEVVSQDIEGSYGVSYGNLVAVLIEALKSQDERIKILEEKLSST